LEHGSLRRPRPYSA